MIDEGVCIVSVMCSEYAMVLESVPFMVLALFLILMSHALALESGGYVETFREEVVGRTCRITVWGSALRSPICSFKISFSMGHC